MLDCCHVKPSLAVNQGSVAVVAAAGVRQTSVNIGVKPSTFECIAMCVTAGTSSYIVLLLYRTGSAAITVSFFAELSDVLDRLSTYVDPFVLAGDLSIRLKCTADPHTVEFCELLDGLVQKVQDFQACHGYEVVYPYPYPYPQIFHGYPWIYPYPQTTDAHPLCM